LINLAVLLACGPARMKLKLSMGLTDNVVAGFFPVQMAGIAVKNRSHNLG